MLSTYAAFTGYPSDNITTKDLLGVCIIVTGFGKLNPSSGIASAYESLGQLLRGANYSVTVAFINHNVPPSEYLEAKYEYWTKFGINLDR